MKRSVVANSTFALPSSEPLSTPSGLKRTRAGAYGVPDSGRGLRLMFVLLIILSFIAKLIVAHAVLTVLALVLTPIARVSIDDAVTLLGPAASMGAAWMSFWAPRTDLRSFAARFRGACSRAVHGHRGRGGWACGTALCVRPEA